MNKTWTIELEEDGVLPLPDELLEGMDLQEGDDIEWIDRGNGSWEIRRVKDREGVFDPGATAPRSRIEARSGSSNEKPVLSLTTEDIRTVYQAVQYLDSGSVDFYVDRSNGIGPVIKVRYQGEIDLTDVSTW
jgi:bifunctional DNA-binding transcriptional regulator/antitoxin component of YhaV-PrlF toxin-antitoxin module